MLNAIFGHVKTVVQLGNYENNYNMLFEDSQLRVLIFVKNKEGGIPMAANRIKGITIEIGGDTITLSIMRVKSKNIAAELLEITFGSQTNMQEW